MDKVFVTSDELSQVSPTSVEPAPFAPPLKPVIAWPVRIALGILVLLLPVLCLVTVVLRISFRNQLARTRLAWTNFTSTLLIVSGLLNTLVFVVALSAGPMPLFVSGSLSSFDEREQFPQLPKTQSMSGAEIARLFKPLVLVVSPVTHVWFSHREVPSASFGAGALLFADRDGYLVATARHVVGNGSLSSVVEKAVVAGESGSWANASVAAVHKRLDLILLWIPRQSGSGDFVQPVGAPEDGRNVFVIGHPQGLKFTLSTGLISRLHDSTVQISAPISPGDSGGPVYDENGNLIAVVTSTVDKSSNPNAEDLNFAVRSDAILTESDWDVRSTGTEHYRAFLEAVRKLRGTPHAH
jgi:S1-C subfamily serine protease